MQLKKLVIALPVAAALSVPALQATGTLAGQATAATPPAAMMKVTKVGTFEKWTSKTSFEMKVGMKPYAVKVNAMTHITENGMKEKTSSLKKGDAIKVKGELEMGTVLAAGIVITRM